MVKPCHHLTLKRCLLDFSPSKHWQMPWKVFMLDIFLDVFRIAEAIVLKEVANHQSWKHSQLLVTALEFQIDFLSICLSQQEHHGAPLFRKKNIKILMTSRPKAATRTSTPAKAGDCTATSTLVFQEYQWTISIPTCGVSLISNLPDMIICRMYNLYDKLE